jgi:hypothetical protein
VEGRGVLFPYFPYDTCRVNPSIVVVDTDYETTAAEDDYDRLVVDVAWAEGGENVPAEAVWAEFGIIAADLGGQDRPARSVDLDDEIALRAWRWLRVGPEVPQFAYRHHDLVGRAHEQRTGLGDWLACSWSGWRGADGWVAEGE